LSRARSKQRGFLSSAYTDAGRKPNVRVARDNEEEEEEEDEEDEEENGAGEGWRGGVRENADFGDKARETALSEDDVVDDDEESVCELADAEAEVARNVEIGRAVAVCICPDEGINENEFTPPLACTCPCPPLPPTPLTLEKNDDALCSAYAGEFANGKDAVTFEKRDGDDNEDAEDEDEDREEDDGGGLIGVNRESKRGCERLEGEGA